MLAMPATTTTLKVPDLLLTAMKTRAIKLGYPSFNSYIMGLGRYDLLCQGVHSITGAIARAPGRLRDKVDSWLLRLAERGVGDRGVLLSHIVDRMQRRQQSELSALNDLVDEDTADWSGYSI